MRLNGPPISALPDTVAAGSEDILSRICGSNRNAATKPRAAPASTMVIVRAFIWLASLSA